MFKRENKTIYKTKIREIMKKAMAMKCTQEQIEKELGRKIEIV